MCKLLLFLQIGLWILLVALLIWIVVLLVRHLRGQPAPLLGHIIAIASLLATIMALIGAPRLLCPPVRITWPEPESIVPVAGTGAGAAQFEVYGTSSGIYGNSDLRVYVLVHPIKPYAEGYWIANPAAVDPPGTWRADLWLGSAQSPVRSGQEFELVAVLAPPGKEAMPQPVKSPGALTTSAQSSSVKFTVGPVPPTLDTATPTASPTPAPSPTSTEIPTATPSPTTPPTPSCVDRAEFVKDVTIPDNTNLSPGTSFVKTWRLRNSGTCTWDSSYAVVFAGGEAMGGPASAPLPGVVAPGDTVDLSLTLTAPAGEGDYQGQWKLQNARGNPFGIGDNADKPFWVEITVGAALVPSPIPICPGSSVTITSPAPDQTVDPTVDAVMAVSGNIPSNCRLVLIVRDPVSQCWAWLHAASEGSGIWRLAGVTLGSESDSGKPFGLVAIITDQVLPAGQVPCYPRGPRTSITIIRR